MRPAEGSDRLEDRGRRDGVHHLGVRSRDSPRKRVEDAAPLAERSVAGHHRDGLGQPLGVDRLEDGFERAPADDHVHPFVPGDELLGEEVQRRRSAAFGN